MKVMRRGPLKYFENFEKFVYIIWNNRVTKGMVKLSFLFRATPEKSVFWRSGLCSSFNLKFTNI